MALPLVGAGVTAGRGLLAYLAKRKAMQEAGKKAVMRTGYGGANAKRIYDGVAMHPRAAAMARARNIDGTMSGGKHIANRFVNAPSGVSKFAKRMGIGGLAAGSFLAGDEYGKRHPRVEAMERLQGNKGDAEPAFVNPFDFPIGSDARREAIENMTEADHRKLADMNRERLRMESGAAIHPEEMVQGEVNWIGNHPTDPVTGKVLDLPDEDLMRIREIDNLNVSEEAKETLRDDLMKRRVYGNDYLDRLSREDASGNLIEEDGRILNPLYGDNYYEGTGAQDLRYIPKYLEEEGGVNTFMGIPKRKSPRQVRSEIDYDSLYR